MEILILLFCILYAAVGISCGVSTWGWVICEIKNPRPRLSDDDCNFEDVDVVKTRLLIGG